MAENESRVLTILLTDIRNFTDRTSRSSRSDVVGLIEKNKQLVLPSLQKRGGRLIKTIGDAFLVVFNSPTDAVLAGMEAQAELARYNEGKPDAEKIEIRIAINVGEVSLVDNDVYGEAVNITSRIEGVAQAGEVFFTEAVYLAMNKTEVPSSEVGYLQLKGVPEKIRVYKVRRETPVGDEGGAPPKLLEEKGAKAWAVPAAPAALPSRKDKTFGRLIALIVVLSIFGPKFIRGLREPKAPAPAPAAIAVDTPQRPCRAEIAQFCKDVPATARHACLLERQSELSSICSESRWFNKAAKSADRPPRPPADWNPKGVDREMVKSLNAACKDDEANLCSDVRDGHGRKVNCLWDHWAELSPACKEAGGPLFQKAADVRP